MVDQLELTLPPYRRGFHLITDEIIGFLPKLPEKGVLNVFIKHTSAAITINENADYKVRNDLENFFSRLVPDGTSWFEHDDEGADDMPAHIKASMIGPSLSIPIRNSKLDLGTWQGIYLCEFRNHGGNRKLLLTIIY
jgi:secondary thiamine-phosphate synthase enzyme